eukprot:CAMPEP_0179061476 /NCGR_PEP_ID=MMETSP0796-20121207/26417_1 /TAXON_ID=73915 /ORGANISM="Pyrodinium bahamense, Strain pbaha01" /LENGTH=54 /DNA_ID=CAMNT_0020758323 /DNA_START=19 /DNA_END=180 /DNA_ORIENTATION=-
MHASQVRRTSLLTTFLGPFSIQVTSRLSPRPTSGQQQPECKPFLHEDCAVQALA